MNLKNPDTKRVNVISVEDTIKKPRADDLFGMMKLSQSEYKLVARQKRNWIMVSNSSTRC